jgi:hypothetical protein
MGVIDFEYASKILDDQVNPKNPMEWIKKTLGIDLWSKQREIIRAIGEYKKVAVKSGHGVGKSFVASTAAVHWIATHPPEETLVVSTAPSARQVHAILWEDIRKLHRKGRLQGEVQRSDNWLIGDTLVGFGRKPQDYDRHAFQGLHRKYVLVIIDEACGIDEWLWIAALAITTGKYCRILAIGNPDDPSSYFAKVCKPSSDWHQIKISVFDSPNFTGEKVSLDVSDQLTSMEWVNEMESEVGRDTPMWTSKVLGEFPEVDEFSVIPLGWIYRAQERWSRWKEENNGTPDYSDRHIVGADIARFGRDKTVFAHRYGDVCTEINVMPKVDTQQTADLLMGKLNQARDLGVVDVNGVGAGVFDKARRGRYHMLPFNGGSRTHLKDASGQQEFYNLRAASLWRLRELLDPSRGSTICLPPDDQLATDLSAPRWSVVSGGKILIESKEDIKKRIGRSPDRGDAVALAFWASSGSIALDSSSGVFHWADPDDNDTSATVDWEEPTVEWELVPYG